MRFRFTMARAASVAVALVIAACTPAPANEAQGSSAAAVSVNSEKVEGKFFLTTFGGPEDSGDNGQLACGGTSDPGSDDPHQRYYAAAKQRFGCGTHIRVEANGKCIVLETTDTGPAAWVEDKAGGPVLDATPLAAQELFGENSFGWSDRKAVQLTIADANTPLGPCDGSTSKGGGGKKKPAPDPTDPGDDDDTTPPPSTGGDDDDDSIAPIPTSPIPTPPDPSTTCQPKSAATLCQAAQNARGVECGSILDNCGAPLDCSTVPGFVCATGSTCLRNTCKPDPTTCQPEPVADACRAAKASSGAECGSVPDGCKSTVSCDGQPGYGCKDDQTCVKNHCSGKSAPASASASAATPGPTAPTPKMPSVGGDDDDGDKSPGPTSSGQNNDPPGAGKPAKDSGGCSAAPASNGGAGSPPSFGLVGIVAFAFGRRRWRRAPSRR